MALSHRLISCTNRVYVDIAMGRSRGGQTCRAPMDSLATMTERCSTTVDSGSNRQDFPLRVEEYNKMRRGEEE